MKPLSLVLIDEIFNMMNFGEIGSGMIGLDEVQMSCLKTMLLNEPPDSIYYLPAVQADATDIVIKMEHLTITFTQLNYGH